MTDQRAYLVLGPESSGTRLMTSLLMAAGCYGDAGHVQRLDTRIPPNKRAIVWRRSLPHGGQWPDVGQLIARLQDSGYTVTVLVMSRDWHALALSQIGAGHAIDGDEAVASIRTAYRRIFAVLAEEWVDFEIVNFEALVARPQQCTAQLMGRLGLAVPETVQVYDANARYYKDDLTSLVRGDTQTVREAIREKYGLEVSDRYANDLVAFVEQLKHPANTAV